jgi:hypothetical protein
MDYITECGNIRQLLREIQQQVRPDMNFNEVFKASQEGLETARKNQLGIYNMETMAPLIYKDPELYDAFMQERLEWSLSTGLDKILFND